MTERTLLLSNASPWLLDEASDYGTVGGTVSPRTIPASTQTTAILLTDEISTLRHRVTALGGDVAKNHRKSYELEWDIQTQLRQAQSPQKLLEELSDEGFAWRDVARMLDVSVPAVKKWRSGERLSGTNRARLSRLVGALDFLKIHYLVDDLGSWMETPLREDVPVTPIDLWISGPPKLFFEYGTRHATVEQTLDGYDADWRERYSSEFEVFRDADGTLGLRMSD
jgi:hypothetical protein